MLNQLARSACRPVWLVFFLLSFSSLTNVFGQPPIEVTEEVMREVFPKAQSYSLKEGNPPVYRALQENPESEELETVGYLFETPDMPPEEIGYSAPVDVLVGMDLKGNITGIKILYYIESYKSIRGDFINSEYFPNQFDDKNIIEGFRIGRDLDGISRATITSWAVSRGIRNAARRVAEAYLSDSEFVSLTSADAVGLQVLSAQSWEDMIQSELVVNWVIIQPDGTELHLVLAFMGHDGLGELLVGDVDYSRADNPTRAVLEKAFASLEGAKYGLAFSSGLAAIQAIVQAPVFLSYGILSPEIQEQDAV